MLIRYLEFVIDRATKFDTTTNSYNIREKVTILCSMNCFDNWNLSQELATSQEACEDLKSYTGQDARNEKTLLVSSWGTNLSRK